MRRTVLALTLLLALAALVPAAFAAQPPALHLSSPAVSPAPPASDLALWLTTTGPIASPSLLCSNCFMCSANGRICCERTLTSCYCASPKFGC